MILKIQCMKLFLTEDTNAFTFARGVVNEKLIFTAKKNMLCVCFFSSSPSFFLVFDFFPLVVSYLFCFRFSFCTENWLTPALIVPMSLHLVH